MTIFCTPVGRSFNSDLAEVEVVSFPNDRASHAEFLAHEHHLGARFAQQLGAVGDRNTVQGAESPDLVRTTTTGTFADCATVAPTEPSDMPANPPRP